MNGGPKSETPRVAQFPRDPAALALGLLTGIAAALMAVTIPLAIILPVRLTLANLATIGFVGFLVAADHRRRQR